MQVPPSCVVELLTAQPALWNVNVTSIVSDRMEALGDKLGVRDMAALIELITRQPLLWVVPPAQIKNSLQQASGVTRPPRCLL